ncbi:hypothetical protein ATCC90586_000259 [Pythium insidiosum]|nr:hypothetical protein ATCC90586_000259 [Pythium insidiosum]
MAISRASWRPHASCARPRAARDSESTSSRITAAGDYFGAFGELERDEEDLKRAQEERANAPKGNPKERVFEKQVLRRCRPRTSTT